MNIGILTSGGDCAGLNAAMHGFVKAITATNNNIKILGIANGWAGLVNREYREMKPEEFVNILNIGGTIIGTSRQPYKKLLDEEKNKVELMKENYKYMDLDVLMVLGGQGTHKTAGLLAKEGLNIIGLPKTIDNDIYGTDFTFGFHSALNVATECIDRIRTTAASHSRTMLVEIMGNKTGWLTLYAGVAGGADIILIPEIPFDMDKVIKAAARVEQSKGYCIIALAEGVMDKDEAKSEKKDRIQNRIDRGEKTATERIAKKIAEALNIETRVMVPGYMQRGGNPCAYDRVLCTQIGAYAAKLVEEKNFGTTVAIKGLTITHNNLSDIAGLTKFVQEDCKLIKSATDVGITFCG